MIRVENDEALSQRQFAGLVGLSPQRIGQLRRNGLPVRRDNGTVLIPVADGIQWLLEQARIQSSPASASDAKARKLAAEAEMAELELARERSQLVTVADCRDRMARMGDRVRGVLLAMPGKWAQRCQGLDTVAEAQGVLREAVGEVLSELSDPS